MFHIFKYVVFSFCKFGCVVFPLSLISRNSNFSFLISSLAQLPLSNVFFRFHEYVCFLIVSVVIDTLFYCVAVR